MDNQSNSNAPAFVKATLVGNPSGYHEIPLAELNRVSVASLQAHSPAPIATPVLIPRAQVAPAVGAPPVAAVEAVAPAPVAPAAAPVWGAAK